MTLEDNVTKPSSLVEIPWAGSASSVATQNKAKRPCKQPYTAARLPLPDL